MAEILNNITAIFSADSPLISTVPRALRDWAMDWRSITASNAFRYIVVPTVAAPILLHVLSPSRNPVTKRLRTALMAHYRVAIGEMNKTEFEELYALMDTVPIGDDRVLSVVDIAAGTGALFPYFPVDVNWKYYAVEPNHDCRAVLEKNVKDFHNVELVQYFETGAEQIGLASGNVDVVIMRHALCSVADARKVLAEIKRILKPGGKFIFFEHVRAENDSVLLIMQQLLKHPLFYMFQCRLCENTCSLIGQAGFAQVNCQKFYAKLPLSLFALRPHISGVAVKGDE